MLICILLMLFINTKIFVTYKFHPYQSSKLKFNNSYKKVVLKESKVNELDLLRSRSKLLENVMNRLKQHVSNVENNLQNEVLLKQNLEIKYRENEESFLNEIQSLKKEIITLKIQLSIEKQESYKYIVRSQLLEKLVKDQQQQLKIQHNSIIKDRNFVHSNIVNSSLNTVMLNKRIDDDNDRIRSNMPTDDTKDMEYIANTSTIKTIATNTQNDRILLSESSTSIDNLTNKSLYSQDIQISNNNNNNNTYRINDTSSNTINCKFIENTTNSIIHNEKNEKKNTFVSTSTFNYNDDDDDDDDVLITSKNLMQIQTERLDQLQSMLLELRNDLKEFQKPTYMIPSAVSSSLVIVNETLKFQPIENVSQLIDMNIKTPINDITTATTTTPQSSLSLNRSPTDTIKPNTFKRIISKIKYLWSTIRSRIL